MAEPSGCIYDAERGYAIHTWTGKAFYPQDIRVDDIDIADIAHGLAMTCRYGGQCDNFYCPTPDQRILTAKLEWKPAGDLVIGDELFAFDEEPHELGSANNKRRRFRPSVVTHAQPVLRKVIRLEMEDGSTIKASEEHPWLISTKAAGNQTWRTAAQIRDDIASGKVRYINRYMDTWEYGASRDAGWLAGIYDGEGSFSFNNRGGSQLSLSQAEGGVLDEAQRILKNMGYNNLVLHQGNKVNAQVINLQLLGGWRENARLLGQIRPNRLLNKFTDGLRGGKFNTQMSGIRQKLRIVAAYDEGEQWVSGLETSTHTYLCEGFAAHNSVAQHSVHCYDLATPENEREALLHDAVEAYLGADFPRPYKLMVPALAKFEESIEQQLNPILGIPVKKSDIMKFIDETMLATEMPLLFQKHGAYIEVRGAYVYTGSETIMSGLPPRLDWDAIPSWTPEYAEERFLDAWDKIQQREIEDMVHRDDAIIAMRNVETLDEARIASIMNDRAHVTRSFLDNLIEVAQHYRKQS